MQRFIASLGAGSALALLILGAAPPAGEEKVLLAKVPKPVVNAVKARFKEATVVGAAKEITDGKLFYELRAKENGRQIDMILTPGGVFTIIEKQTSFKELPEAVAKTLSTKYPKAKYRIIEEVWTVQDKQEKFSYYEGILTARKQLLEVKVEADGKLLSETKYQPE